MTAQQLVQFLTNASFILVFIAVTVRAVRRPSRETFDIVLFFGAPAIAITQGWILSLLGVRANPTLSLVSAALVMAMPLLTLRAVEGLTTLPRLVIPAAAIGWAVVAIVLMAAPTPMPPAVLLPLVAYFVVFELYAGVLIFRATRGARGVTRRRLQLVAAGTVLLALVILAAGVAVVLPFIPPFTQPLALAAGLTYLVGFAPPGVLLRAWQAPEVYAFVRSTNRLVAEPSTDVVNSALAAEIARAMGERDAGLGLWSEERAVLTFWRTSGPPIDRRLDESLASRAFQEQRVIIETEEQSGKRLPDEYRRPGRRVVLAAPVTAGTRRIGVVAVLVERRATFFEDDLDLLRLLGDQTAVVLEHRRLVDEVRGLNSALERSVTELRMLNDELASFAYSVSHDLRAPLRAIDGFSQVLLEDKSEVLGEDGRGYLDRVRAAATRMGALIDDLLMLSRLTREQMRAERVDLTALARSVVDELRAREPQRAVEFDANGALPAMADARLLRIALTNLVGNAWKFTRDRRPAHITFGGEARDGESVFFVKDDGVGFDPRYAQKLFGAFQRLHSSSEFEGTGIGLAIVQRIIHRHGGRVWAESEVGKGATFYFTLPPSATTPTEARS